MTAAAPTLYDVRTDEPLRFSAAALHPLQAAAPRTSKPREFDAPVTLPALTDFRIVADVTLVPPGRLERLIPIQDRIVALGPDEVRVLAGDLRQQMVMPVKAGARVDVERRRLYMTDVFGGVIGARLPELTPVAQLVPTYPSGYERRVLFSDADRVLLASIEMQPMTSSFTHVPDITMFEWWDLPDSPGTPGADPPRAKITAVTYSRTRPLIFAASPRTGDPLVLVQAGHLLWLDHSLALADGVAVDAAARPLALEVDRDGHALVVVRTAKDDRFWIVDRSGRQLCDEPLAERADDQAPQILPGSNGRAYVIAGRVIECFDAQGTPLWRSRMPEAPLHATVVEPEGGLFVASGRRLVRVAAGGHSDLVYEAEETITSRPAVVNRKILLATANGAMELAPR